VVTVTALSGAFCVSGARRQSAGLLSAIGIAGMDRMIQANVIAMSGRAVEAAGDVDMLLLDKTGTITLGQPAGHRISSRSDVDIKELAEAAQLSSLADETPEGRSIVVLAKENMACGARIHENLKPLLCPLRPKPA
jgi:potassium-transporting ATPase ATP-binding subunit